MQEVYSQTGVSKLLSSPDDFSDYVEQRIEATKQLSYSIRDLVTKQNLLTPIEGARTIAAAVSFGVWGLDEFIASSSPGPSWQAAEFMTGARPPGVLSGSHS